MTMACDEEGGFGYRSLLAAMYAALGEMVDDGFVRAAEMRRMAIPTVARSRADFMAPFAATGHFAGLAVEKLDVFRDEDRFWTEFERNRDAHAFAAGWAAFARASVAPSLASARDGGHDDLRAAAFAGRMESGTGRRMAAVPKRRVIALARMRLVKGG
jgi:hypothetical protein